jgi:hypothetical protein
VTAQQTDVVPVSCTDSFQSRDGLAQVTEVLGGGDEIADLQRCTAVDCAERGANDQIDGLRRNGVG